MNEDEKEYARLSLNCRIFEYAMRCTPSETLGLTGVHCPDPDKAIEVYKKFKTAIEAK